MISSLPGSLSSIRLEHDPEKWTRFSLATNAKRLRGKSLALIALQRGFPQPVAVRAHVGRISMPPSQSPAVGQLKNIPDG
jgi:hypothetical protein